MIKLVTPTGMNGYWTVSFNLGGIGNYASSNSTILGILEGVYRI